MLCIVNGMSEHDQPSSTPAAELAAEDDEALMKMQRDFPGHRIWREIIPAAPSTSPGPRTPPPVPTPSSPPTYVNCMPH
jgi:hypothetical protein